VLLCFHEFFAKKAWVIFSDFPHCDMTTVWKNEKFGLTEKIFRQIDSSVICLVKPLLSRNFCRKSVRLKLQNFHIVAHHSVEITKFYCYHFSQKFREINFLRKNFTPSWFDKKNFAWQWISHFSTLCTRTPNCGKTRNSLSHKKNFVKSTRYLVISLIKLLL